MEEHGLQQKEFDPSRFFESFFWVARELVLRPQLFFRNLPSGASLRSPLMFLMTNSFLAALFIANYRGGGFTIFVALMTANIASALTAGLILHGMALRLSTSPGRICATMRIVCYASIVDIAAWIPAIGLIPYCYGLYLIFLGLQEVHKMSPRQAGLALISIIILITVLVSMLIVLAPEGVRDALKLLDPQQS